MGDSSGAEENKQKIDTGEEENRQKIDTAVGTIVWVRRRNGSWWPGRILGCEELSTTHLMSPRSGTPVKLLGRDDASVDWYNIEKSKRVKAFRCGEYDECIEKAKASANLPAKKIVKYARREDAILHALELERKQFQKDNPDYEELLAYNNPVAERQSQAYNHLQPDDNNGPILSKDEDMDADSPVDGLQSALSFQQMVPSSAAISQSIQNIKQLNEADLEEDSIEGMTRMRGLRDFGLKTAPKRKQPNMPANTEGIPNVELTNNIIDNASNVNPSLVCGSPETDNKRSLTLAKKRDQVGSVQENSAKRRDRRRPLTRVLERSAKLQESSLFDYDNRIVEPVEKWATKSDTCNLQSKIANQSSLSAFPRNNSLFTETSLERNILLHTSTTNDCETIDGDLYSVSLITDNACSNLSDHVDVNCCDNSYFHPGYHMEENAPTDSSPVQSNSTSKEFETSRMEQYPRGLNENQLMSMNKEGLDETGFLNHFGQSGIDGQSLSIADRPVSEWQSKGRRNTRCVNKRNYDSVFGKTSLDTSDACTSAMYSNLPEDKEQIGREMRKKKPIEDDNYDNLMSSEESEEDFSQDQSPDFFPDFTSGRNPKKRKSSMTRRTAYLQPPSQTVHSQRKIASERVTDVKPSVFSDKTMRAKWLRQTDTEGILKQKVSPEDLKELSSRQTLDNLNPGSYQINVSKGRRMHGIHGSLESDDFVDPLSLDVPILVKAKTHQGEHVPLVSLRSKLNGKAIVGHPVTVETLKDGYCDAYFDDNDFSFGLATQSENYQCYDTIDGTKQQAVQAPWRTGRRTEMQRFPRNHQRPSNRNAVTSQLLGSQEKHISLNSEYLDGPVKSMNVKNNSSRKLTKRVSQSSKKTRALSSIGIENESKYGNGSMRSLRLSDPPLITCIPLKLVFSRIKEAVGNSSKPGSCGLSSSG